MFRPDDWGARRSDNATLAQARAVLVERLVARRAELEQLILTRVFAISEAGPPPDPIYAQGLRATVGAAIDYAMEALEYGEAPPPTALLAQARLAARHGVGLDIVMRRYLAGYTILDECLTTEARCAGLDSTKIDELLPGRAALFDRLLAAMSEEYAREDRSRLKSSEERRAERIARLLAGELIDTSDWPYELAQHHLALICDGTTAPQALRGLATALDTSLLFVRRGPQVVWAWLGARLAPDPTDVERVMTSGRETIHGVALGEPAEGLAGWRLSHRQAAAAFSTLGGSRERVRYADVSLLASILKDELIVTSLRRLYLDPLSQERDGGTTLLQTLRAYFAAEEQTSSAAHALRVSRQTVENRLRKIEGKLDRRIRSCASEIALALQLEELERHGSVETPVRTQAA